MSVPFPCGRDKSCWQPPYPCPYRSEHTPGLPSIRALRRRQRCDDDIAMKDVPDGCTGVVGFVAASEKVDEVGQLHLRTQGSQAGSSLSQLATDVGPPTQPRSLL